jgi:hypothetical protein
MITWLDRLFCWHRKGHVIRRHSKPDKIGTITHTMHFECWKCGWVSPGIAIYTTKGINPLTLAQGLVDRDHQEWAQRKTPELQMIEVPGRAGPLITMNPGWSYDTRYWESTTSEIDLNKAYDFAARVREELAKEQK